MKKIYLLLFILSCNYLPVKSQSIKSKIEIDTNLLNPKYTLNLIIKFKSDYNFRIRKDKLTDLGKSDLPKSVIKKLNNGKLFRQHNQVSETRLDEMYHTAVKNNRSNEKIENLNNYYIYKCSDIKEIYQIRRMLKKYKCVEYCNREYRTIVTSPPSNSYEGSQSYLHNSAVGINASTFWSTYSNRGVNVKIADIENGVNVNHQDLQSFTAVSNSSIDADHGTSVAGMLISKNNGWGTTGIVSDCQYFFFSSKSGNYNVASAISSAVANYLNQGDIILLELAITQGPNYNGTPDFGSVPLEWDESIYQAILTASNNGVIVVEPAGNGSQNLNDAIYSTGHNGHYPFNGSKNSGAIMVGAGANSSNTQRSRLNFSNYGSRVDLQGIGENVVTTGWEGGSTTALYNLEGTNYYYTNIFRGTSSASPMIVGAIALIQSKYRQSNGGVSLSKDQILTALKATAKPQQAGSSNPVSQNIGGLPDVVAAYNYISTPASNDNCLQATQLTSNTSCSYQNFSVASATASSGFSIPNCSGLYSSSALDVWFQFTAQATSHTINVDPDGTYSGNSDNNYIDPVVAVYSTCNDGSLIQCEDDFGGGGGNCDLTLNGLNIGSIYYIRVFDYSAGSTIPPNNPNFGICVTHNSTTCPTPTSPVEATIGQTYVDLDWDLMSGANTYAIRYRKIGGSWNNFTNTNSNYSINNLTCNTAYEWEVSSTCSSNSSNWTTTRQFTTLACTNTCGTPQNMQTSNITDNSVNLNTGNSSVFGAVGYEFRYRIVGSSNWITTYSSTTIKDINNLVCNSTYEWQMRTDCGSGNFSAYTNLMNFTTLNCPQTCSAPTNLTQSSPTFDKIDMQWSNVSNAMNYTVYIKETAGSNWFNFTSRTNQKSLSNLTCKTDYVWYVVANCTSTSSPNSQYSNHTSGNIGSTELRTPLNGSSVEGNFITFSWDTVHKVSKYEFQFGYDPQFNTIQFNNTDQSKYYITGNKLNIDLINFPQNGTVIYWRVIPLSDICQQPIIPNPFNFKSVGVGSNINSVVKNTDFSIFPNPTTGVIFITNISKGKLVEVFTIDGKKVKEVFTTNKVDISDKENGTYILKIDTNTFKVILSK